MSRYVRSWWARWAIAVAVVAMAVSAIGGSSALAGRLARIERQSASSGIPWREVGPGWAVAEYSATSLPSVPHRVRGKTTLYVVSPQGRKHSLYQWPATSDGSPRFSVIDWSGDRQRVLLQQIAGLADQPVHLEQISVVTGKVISRFTLPPGVIPIGYTRPDGLNVLAVAYGTHGVGQVRRYDLAGRLQSVLARNASPYGTTPAIDSPDGTSVVVGTASGLEQVRNNVGTVIKRLRLPVAVLGCAPVRWWSTRTVLASCQPKRTKGIPPARLWLFGFGSGKVTALTAQRVGGGLDEGDVAAWKLTSGVYLRAETGDCGIAFIATQWRNGSVHVVNLPSGKPSIGDDIVTAFRSRLLVLSSGCVATGSLLWFDPGARSVKYVIRSPANVLGVLAVIPYGRPTA